MQAYGLGLDGGLWRVLQGEDFGLCCSTGCRSAHPPQRNQTNRVLRMHFSEHPLSVVHQHGDVGGRTPSESHFAEFHTAFGRQRGAWQHNANPTAVLRRKMPEAPEECLLEIGVARTHSGIWPRHQALANPVALLPLYLEGFDEIAALPVEAWVNLLAFRLAH